MFRALALIASCLTLEVVVLPAVAAGPLDAQQQWPRWRGPLDSGEAPHADPPLTWSEDHNVRFKVAVPGNGNSSPIVWGDLIFLTTAVPHGEVDEAPAGADSHQPERRRRMGLAVDQDMRFTLLALDRATGKEVWRRAELTARPHEGTHRDGS